MPWIALAQGLIGLYLIPMNGATMGARKSGFVWAVSGFAAATNVVLLLLVVPSHGILGGAVSYAATGLVLLLGISVYARSPRNPNSYDWRALLPVVGAAVISYAGAALTAPGASVLAGVERLAWLSLFAAAALTITRSARSGIRVSVPAQ